MPCVVFVRGANVGGHNKFSTAQVASALEELGVRNVGAAGTFVVTKAAAVPKVRAAFAKLLPSGIDFAIVPVEKVEGLLASKPFAKMQPEVQAFVSVLMASPKKRPSLPLEKPADPWGVRVLALQGNLVLSLQNRALKQPVYPNQVVESVYGVPATTRGWPTFERIGAILEG
jgi:uncharacterized protein (DUF1697 family)